MNVLSWNCRGLNTSTNPTISHLCWLVSMYKPSFVFLQETKSSVDFATRVLRHTNPRYVFGVDADGTRGGLVVFCWAPVDVSVVCSSSHYVFCKLSASNGKVWYLLFLYGEAQH